MHKLLALLAAMAEVTVLPGLLTDERVLVGKTAKLTCSQKEFSNLVWMYRKARGDEPDYIYSNREVHERYRPRVTDRGFHLFISNAQFDDAGLYSCIEYSYEHFFRVTVLELEADWTTCAKENVKLSCRPEIHADVDWKYREHMNDEPYFVYSNGAIYDRYQEKFSIDLSVNGTYTLILSNAQPEDAGFYSCYEDGGFGREHITRLLVSETCGTTTESDWKQQEDDEKRVSTTFVVPVACALVVFVITLLSVIFLWCCCRRKLKRRRAGSTPRTSTCALSTVKDFRDLQPITTEITIQKLDEGVHDPLQGTKFSSQEQPQGKFRRYRPLRRSRRGAFRRTRYYSAEDVREIEETVEMQPLAARRSIYLSVEDLQPEETSNRVNWMDRL